MPARSVFLAAYFKRDALSIMLIQSDDCITGCLLRVQAARSAAVTAAAVVAAAAVDTSKKPKELGFTMPGTLICTCLEA